MPGGTATWTECVNSASPEPPQASQLSVHVSPRPPQGWQVRRTGNSRGTMVPVIASTAVSNISALKPGVVSSGARNASRIRSMTASTAGKSIATSSANQLRARVLSTTRLTDALGFSFGRLRRLVSPGGVGPLTANSVAYDMDAALALSRHARGGSMRLDWDACKGMPPLWRNDAPGRSRDRRPGPGHIGTQATQDLRMGVSRMRILRRRRCRRLVVIARH